MPSGIRPADAVRLYDMLRNPKDQDNDDLAELINLLVKVGCKKSSGKSGTGGHSGGTLKLNDVIIFTYSTKSYIEEKCNEAKAALIAIGTAGITDVNLARIVLRLALADAPLSVEQNAFIEKS